MLVVVVLLYIHSGGSSATTLYVHRIKEVIIINWNFCRQLIFVKQRVICEHKPSVCIYTYVHACMHNIYTIIIITLHQV